MTFVTAWLAAAGAIAMAVPIVIHLLSRQRRRPVEWAAMRFLLEAIRKHKRRIQVQQILLLAVRCLILLLLGAALARPILTQAGLLDRGGNRIVYLIIDDGLASSLMLNNETALERSTRQAREIITALDPGDRVGLVTASRPAQSRLAPATSDHSAVLGLLAGLQPSDAPTDIAGAMLAMRSILERDDDDAEHTFVYLLSEFRAGSAPTDAPLPAAMRDLGPRVTLLAPEPAQQSVGNVQIAAIDPVRSVIIAGRPDANGSSQVTVRLARSGDNLAADVSRVRLTAEPSAVIEHIEPRIVRWESGQSNQSVDFMLRFITGGTAFRAGSPGPENRATFAAADQEIAITARLDDDALDADNMRHAVLNVRDHIRVVLLDRRTFGFEVSVDRYRAGQWMRRALEPYEHGPLQIVEVEPAALSVSDLRAAEVVIATRPDLITDAGWSILRDHVDGGGLFVVTPPGELIVHRWTERLTNELDLPWRIGIEVRDHEDGLFLADEQPPSEILRLIAGDVNDLARPVVTHRTLPVEVDGGQGSQSGTGDARTLLQFADESPMLITGSPRLHRRASTPEEPVASRGLVALFATAPELDWTSLPSKPLMVPLVHEMVRQGLGAIRASHQLVAGEQAPVAGGSGRAAVELRRRAHAAEPMAVGGRIALDAAGRPQRPVTSAGLYDLLDVSSQRIGTVAVNVDPHSGRSDVQTPAIVSGWLAGSGPWRMFDATEREGLASMMRSAAAGSPLAWMLLVIVLALIVIETLLARWFSYSIESAGEQPKGLRATLARASAMVTGRRPATAEAHV
jgi:hypothetical protein